MKYISKILAILMVMAVAVACHLEDCELALPEQDEFVVGVFGDEMHISLNVVAPDPVQVDTRAVDPDGKTLQTLNLFCFDANGLFLTTATAKINGKSEDNLKGTFDAVVPKTTRIIHLLANQNMSVFNKDEYVFRTEDDVLSALEGSAGMLIYWARVQAPANVGGCYPEAVYVDDNDQVIEDYTRSEAEAFVDWITIETNPTTETHRGIAGKGHPIIMLRNQAKFTIVSEEYEKDGDEFKRDDNGELVLNENQTDEWNGTFFHVTGFAICNTPAFGTVAPYHTQYGFPTYSCSTFKPAYGIREEDGPEQVVGEETPEQVGEETSKYHYWLDKENPFVTLATRRDKMSDIADVTNQREMYVFETTNLGNDPVDLILKGSNIVYKDGQMVEEPERYYYRVNILDDEAELIDILRNHHYEIHITGNLTNGCLTFGEAVVAPPTNNVWLSISDEVTSVRNNDFVLSVKKTKAIVETYSANGMPKNSELTLEYNVRKIGDKPFDENKLSFYWIESDQKVSNTYNPSLVLGQNVTYDPETGDGTIRLNMSSLPDGVDYERGSIVVKYGHLQRKIRVILLRTQEFVPTWVSSEVCGKVDGSKESRSNVTVVFTIPETCPAELFPMDVLVTTNGLDGRAATGQILPIVRSGEDGYGLEDEFFKHNAPDGAEINDIGYKYKYTVTAPGQHRLYFENILNMIEEDEEGNTKPAPKEYVTIEAKYFDILTKIVTYVKEERNIVLPFLPSYSANKGASEEEKVQYILVPQKRYAPIVFDVSLKEANGTPYGTIDNEEFLLYSTNLDHLEDGDIRVADKTSDNNGTFSFPFSEDEYDCYFKPYGQNVWSTGGRIFGFYPREEKLSSGNFWETKSGTQIFSIYLETNKPNSAEVVRIASNQKNSASVITDRMLYTGDTFRSVTFELVNHRPFRFAAKVNNIGEYKTDNIEVAADGDEMALIKYVPESEVVDNITFEYEPNEEVAVSFDVTSFRYKDGQSIDPFGEAFEIFIDAPALTLEKGMNKSVAYNSYGKNFEDISVSMYDKDKKQYVNKPKLEDLGNGRFVYRVNARSNDEYIHWSEDPLIRDPNFNSPLTGDRKTIRFKKSSIVSSGQITISANPEHVTYHSKTFNVSNMPITGKIMYMPNGATEGIQLPEEQFVSFAREYDGSRIGSMSIKAKNDGSTYFELRLRAEYEFSWTNDPIKITSSIGGKYYSTVVADLATLYQNAKNNVPIILVEEVEEEE